VIELGESYPKMSFPPPESIVSKMCRFPAANRRRGRRYDD